MKKITVLKTLLSVAVLAFVFTSCDQKGSSDKITSLTVKPSTITLSPGDSTRLAVLYEPAGANPDIKWASSNEEVVSVSSNGTIRANSVGVANITATSGEFTSACAVTVQEYLASLSFTGAFVFDYDTTYSYQLDTLRSQSWGDKYYVAKKVLCNMMVFTEGFYIDDEGYFAGASKGAILEFEAPFYWAPAWANNGSGTIFVLGDWEISNDYPDSTTTVGHPYSIKEAEYTDAINTFVQDYYVEGDASKIGPDLQYAAGFISGATLKTYEYHSVEEGYSGDGYFSSYIPDLMIGEGTLELSNNYTASSYMCSVESYDLNGKEFSFDTDTTTYEFYMFGAHFQETEESIDLLDSKVYFGNEYSYVREANKASKQRKVAGAKELRPLPVRELTPEVKARIREQLNRTDLTKK